MSTTNRPADGIIVSGRGMGQNVYCFREMGSYPISVGVGYIPNNIGGKVVSPKVAKEIDDLLPDSKMGAIKLLNESTGVGIKKAKELVEYYMTSKHIFTPQTVARIEILASTSTGPSASNFVKGTLLAGAAVGAAAAMATIGSEHTVKVTWKDNEGSKESIITFNNSNGFQIFIGQLGSLMNQPNEATPAPPSPAMPSPAFSAADEILKFKKLMDEGIITQAEFEAKKKQLLGIENAGITSPGTDIAKQYSGDSDENARELYEELSTTNIGGVVVSPDVGALIIKYLQNHPDNGKMAAIKMLKDSTGIGLKEAKMAVETCMAAIARKEAEDAHKDAEERAEKILEEKEEAKNRFNAYWEAHSDEREKLESEQKDLKEQIAALRASQTEQVTALKNEIEAIPGKAEIDELNERMVKLNQKKYSLGMFKGKEKKSLEAQIDQAIADKKAVQDRMDAAKKEIENRISVVNSEIREKLSPLQSRVKSIDAELTKSR